MIPYGRQDIDEADIGAVVDVLNSDWLTQGPSVPRFEDAVAKRCNVFHAVRFIYSPITELKDLVQGVFSGRGVLSACIFFAAPSWS